MPVPLVRVIEVAEVVAIAAPKVVWSIQPVSGDHAQVPFTAIAFSGSVVYVHALLEDVSRRIAHLGKSLRGSVTYSFVVTATLSPLVIDVTECKSLSKTSKASFTSAIASK